jgi:hypothetical protein
MYVCMYACVHKQPNVEIDRYAQNRLNLCMYVCTYVRMYVCMYVRMYACMYVCVRVHHLTLESMECTDLALYAYVYMYVWYVYMHVFMHVCLRVYHLTLESMERTDLAR